MVIREGMNVYSADGVFLGFVRNFDEETFRVADDRFFVPQREFEFRYGEIIETKGDELRVARDHLHMGEVGAT